MRRYFMINRWTRVALAGVLAATLSMPMIAQSPTAPAVQEKTKAEKEAEESSDKSKDSSSHSN
jgi:hypothetical protein